MARKRRTREHIIADLGVNHVERIALLCGYSVERIVHDYGIDLLIFTYDANGERENDSIRVQVKATDHLHIQADGRAILVRVSMADIQAWRDELMPCILVLYDAQRDRAFWLGVRNQTGLIGDASKATHTLHLPVESIWDEGAVRRIAAEKNELSVTLRRLLGNE